MTYFRFAGVLLLAAVAGCVVEPEAEPEPEPEPALRYFGFVGVACGADYSDEVAGFTNVATACAPDPSVAGLVGEQLDRFAARQMGALLNAEGLFFEPDPLGREAPHGGTRLVLRADYRQRWAAFADGAGLAGRQQTLAAVFVADEPTWRGVDPVELARAFEVVRASLPGTPLLLVEAYPVVARLVVPAVVDWVAFDRYGVADPEHDPEYLADLATLKARRSRPGQRVVVVMEAQWLPAYGDAGFPPEAMAGVAESYYRLARKDPSVIGLVGYLWAGAADVPGQRPARELPASVRAAYQRIGRAIVRPSGP